MTSRPVVIVLAAGRGSRFLGTEHKLVQPLGGLTVFGTTLGNAIASQLEVVVVTTEGLADVARDKVAARDVVILPEVGASNEGSLGMGHSISAGVAAKPDAGGWLVLPADMPLVQPVTIQAVARQLEHYPVVFAQYKGRRGHPVGFSAELYSELITLNGDEGARRLTARYPAFGLEVDDAGVLVDVDTLADLDSVRQSELAAAAPAPRW